MPIRHLSQQNRKYYLTVAGGLLLLVIALITWLRIPPTLTAPPCDTAQGQPCPSPTHDDDATAAAPTATPVGDGWLLVWSDEFDGPSIDRNNWTFDIGGGGWGNNELQYYTDRPENARLENGMLVIEAREERFRHRNYSSARLKTQGLQEWTYGRIEARIKVPHGPGLWPAFWSLGDNFAMVGWPRSGEIDIMEHIGREPATVYGTVHGPDYSGAKGVGGHHTLPDGQLLSDDFHLFAIEWEPDEIRWYMDNIRYFTLTSSELPGRWVFDHPFFLILNVAVGGQWPGSPDETTTFPQFMVVDYVRVYQR